MSNDELQLAINTVWVVVAAVLVLFMQAGFAMLEVGFSRGKNVGAVVGKILVNLAIATVVFWAVGFGFAFGDGNDLFGTRRLLPSRGTSTSFASLSCPACRSRRSSCSRSSSAPCRWRSSGARCSTARSSAVYVVFAIFFAALHLPARRPLDLGRRLADGRGMQDFAGSTVVHLCGARPRSPARS